MDRFNEMTVFLRVVEMRGFRKAAEALGIPASTASEIVKRTERRLGVKLLERTTRMVAPTLDGEVWYDRCLKIIHDLEEAEAGFRNAVPEGRLRVEAHGTLARHFLLPALPAFLEAHPGLDLVLSEGDRLIDPAREGVDCVLRVGIPADSDLVGRQVGLLTEVTVASPGYLQQFGIPGSPDDLAGHRMVGFLSSQTGQALPLWFTLAGVEVVRPVPVALTTSGAETMVAAARQGIGLVQAPHYHLADDLRSGRLIEVLADARPLPSPVTLLYPMQRQLSPRVRVFLDWVRKIDFSAEA